MKRLDVYASEPHFIDHIVPVWLKLPNEVRGEFRTKAGLLEYTQSFGVDASVEPPTNNPTLVASWGDYRKTSGQVIYMEHGIGHSYSNEHPSYSGSPGKDRVTLFLNQHKFTERRNKNVYPDVEHAVIGVPRMDNVPVRGVEGRTVAISFHWDCKVAPETRSAFEHYRRFIPKLAKMKKIKLIGHSHPNKAWRNKIQPVFQRHGVEFVETFDEVLERADVYIIDNSSTAYEFAAAGRPVINLNAPWYRKNINHGIRFWEHIPGPQVDDGWAMMKLIPQILDNPNLFETERQTAVKALFPYQGRSAKRAANIIEAHL